MRIQNRHPSRRPPGPNHEAEHRPNPSQNGLHGFVLQAVLPDQVRSRKRVGHLRPITQHAVLRAHLAWNPHQGYHTRHERGHLAEGHPTDRLQREQVPGQDGVSLRYQQKANRSLQRPFQLSE